jgi:pimeloyl-ACP methyl ester carboxylesterase
MRANINGAELQLDTFGTASDPAVLLIMGAAASMDRWEPAFCERLAAAGRYVIRYDHRDTGGSTTYPPGEPGYTADDLGADAVGVLDHLGVDRAALVGMSMGGGIAQTIAVRHPERVAALALLSTTSAGTGGPELPGTSDTLKAAFGGEGAPEPDWSDRAAAIAHLLEAERPYAGGRGLDEPALREVIALAYDRTPSPASAENHFMVDGTSFAHERLAEIAVPTVVVHGADDPMFPPAHGEALAAAIPGAELLVLEGLGHEFPRSAWDEVLPALIGVTRPRPGG